jgi:hypothetical protein
VDKVTLVVERADEGKLRATCSAWSDPVVALAGECLVLMNIDRQVHVLRDKPSLTAAAMAVGRPSEHYWPTELGEDVFEGVE